MISPNNKFEDIKDSWLKFQSKEENKKIRIRDAADQLGCSEADLLSTEVGDTVSFLNVEDINTLFADILSTDRIMLLVRNDSVVHEKTINTEDINIIDGSFIDISKQHPVLEYDLASFQYSFFQKKIHANKILSSFQFFNQIGDSVLKIYSKNVSDSAFDPIVSKYMTEYGYEVQSREYIDKKPSINNNSVCLYFNDNVASYDCNKHILPSSSLRKILNKSSEKKIAIQVHCLGLSAVQYHIDRVDKIVDYGPWLNVIDNNFNLHVLESEIISCTLNEYNAKGDRYFSINFLDEKENCVLGITSVSGYENDFLELVRSLEVDID